MSSNRTPYLWYCARCRHKNSNATDRCMGCGATKPRSVPATSSMNFTLTKKTNKSIGIASIGSSSSNYNNNNNNNNSYNLAKYLNTTTPTSTISAAAVANTSKPNTTTTSPPLKANMINYNNSNINNNNNRDNAPNKSMADRRQMMKSSAQKNDRIIASSYVNHNNNNNSNDKTTRGRSSRDAKKSTTTTTKSAISKSSITKRDDNKINSDLGVKSRRPQSLGPFTSSRSTEKSTVVASKTKKAPKRNNKKMAPIESGNTTNNRARSQSLLANNNNGGDLFANSAQSRIGDKSNLTTLERKAFSTYSVTNAIRPEVISVLAACIRNSSEISSGAARSKSAAALPTLRQTIEQQQTRLRQMRKTLMSESKENGFVDDRFKTNRGSLYLSTEESARAYDQLIAKWLRIDQIRFDSTNKDGGSRRLITHAPSQSDVVTLGSGGGTAFAFHFRQGTIGDCWLICSLACLVWQHREYLSFLLPEAGIRSDRLYQAFFCIDGRWQSIEIDDFFPCDQSDRLVFSQTLDNQIFAPLLEKALAKHHSCYKALSAGTVLEGFSNLTGMPCKRYEIDGAAGQNSKIETDRLFRKICLYLKRFRYLVSAGCARAQYGLHASHAYSILDVSNDPARGPANSRALLLWNPWGKQELTGPYRAANVTITEQIGGAQKKQKSQTVPGSFWIRFRDFIDCFENVDVCKLNSRWHCRRFEFALPFDIDDQRNFTIFTLDCTAPETFIEFTLYQRVHRDVKFRYRVDISLAIFRQLPKNGDRLRFVATNRVSTATRVSSFGKRLRVGRYVVAVIGINHWGATSRLKEAPTMVLAFHGSKRFAVNALSPDIHLLGDMLIEMAVRIGEKKTDDTSLWSQYVIKKNFCCFVVVIENRNQDAHLIAKYDVDGGSRNAFSVRTQRATCDLIPPRTRQIVTILARECDKDEVTFASSASLSRDRNYPAIAELANLDSHPDVRTMSALFAPRRLASTDEENGATDKPSNIRGKSGATSNFDSDSEDEDTWRAVRNSKCCFI